MKFRIYGLADKQLFWLQLGISAIFFMFSFSFSSFIRFNMTAILLLIQHSVVTARKKVPQVAVVVVALIRKI